MVPVKILELVAAFASSGLVVGIGVCIEVVQGSDVGTQGQVLAPIETSP